MNDRRLVELLVGCGRIAYGMAYMKIYSLEIVPTYELLKEELKSMSKEEKLSYGKVV